MKKAFVVLALLFFCVSVSAQVIVSQASRVAWDDPNPPGVATSFRVYLSQTPGIVPDGTSFIAEVPGDTHEWLISSGPGAYYCVITLVNDNGISVIETGPSNEVWYRVPSPLENARAIREE